MRIFVARLVRRMPGGGRVSRHTWTHDIAVCAAVSTNRLAVIVHLCTCGFVKNPLVKFFFPCMLTPFWLGTTGSFARFHKANSPEMTGNRLSGKEKYRWQKV
jgi:hypothetical protein